MRSASSFRLLSQLDWTHAGIQANELDVTSGLLSFAPPEFSINKWEAGKLRALVAELLCKSFDLQSQHPNPWVCPIWDHAHQRLTVGRVGAVWGIVNSSASCVWLATGTCAIGQVSPRGGTHVRLRGPPTSIRTSIQEKIGYTQVCVCRKHLILV